MQSHIAVVGAGVAGLTVASRLLKSARVHVTLFEAQELPGGLINSSVAFDNTAIKSLPLKLCKSLLNYTNDGRERFLYVNNVQIGREIQPHHLANSFDHVVVASGLDSYVPSHPNLKNIRSPLVMDCRTFVNYFNGLPGSTHEPKFSRQKMMKFVETVKKGNISIVGSGNVALDIAKQCLKSYDSYPCYLSKSVIESLELLQSKISGVTVIAKQPIHRSSCTTAHLREVCEENSICFDSPVVNAKLNRVAERRIKMMQRFYHPGSRFKLVDNYEVQTYDHQSAELQCYDALKKKKVAVNSMGVIQAVGFAQHKHGWINQLEMECMKAGATLHTVGWASTGTGGVGAVNADAVSTVEEILCNLSGRGSKHKKPNYYSTDIRYCVETLHGFLE